MPKGKRYCPVCNGTGKVTENTQEYDFISRDPITGRCLVCNGSGVIGTRAILPNGERVSTLGTEGPLRSLKRQDPPKRRLNVSSKAVINPESTPSRHDPMNCGSGEPSETPDHLTEYDTLDGAATDPLDLQRRGIETQPAWKTACVIPPDPGLPPRLNKVLASGKDFLIVTITEPYYMDVYRMIRAQERSQNTWSDHDEAQYVSALENAYFTPKEASNG